MRVLDRMAYSLDESDTKKYHQEKKQRNRRDKLMQEGKVPASFYIDKKIYHEFKQKVIERRGNGMLGETIEELLIKAMGEYLEGN